jgi:phage terminase small subunit
MKSRRKLTPKQQAFITAYLSNGRNGAEAYRTAYQTNGSPKACAEAASRLLRNSNIAAILLQAEQKAAAKVEQVTDQYAVSKERVVAELARLSFSNMQDYLEVGPDGVPALNWAKLTRDQAGALAEVTVDETVLAGKEGEQAVKGRKIKFKLYDRRAALVDLARIRGYIVDRHDVRVRSVEDLKDEDISGLIGELEPGAAAKPPSETTH